GIAGVEKRTLQKATRWTPGGGSGPTRFKSAVESIPQWAERLRYVDILSMDAFELLDKVSDRCGVVIYADPPYLSSTRGGTKYLHDFDQSCHERLAASLSIFNHARVVVSY